MTEIGSTRKQFIIYCAVGLFSVVVDFLSYLLFNQISFFNPSLAKKVSYLIGSMFSFIGNKVFTFKSKEKGFKEPILFSIIYVISFIANSIVHDHLVKIIDNIFPFIIATATSIIINFYGQKFIVFSKK